MQGRLQKAFEMLMTGQIEEYERAIASLKEQLNAKVRSPVVFVPPIRLAPSPEVLPYPHEGTPRTSFD